jgi:hypothetical protein
VVKYIVSLARTSIPLQKRLVAMSSSLKARFTSPDRRPVYEAATASLSISINREDVISSALRNLGESCASFSSFEDFGARNTPHLEADSPLIWICFDRAPCRPCVHQRAAVTRLRHQQTHALAIAKEVGDREAEGTVASAETSALHESMSGSATS